MTERTRREVIRTGGLLLAGLSAGCTGATDGAGPTDTPTSTATGTPTPTETPDSTPTPTPASPGIVDVTFSSGEGSCGSTASAAVTSTEEGFRATGEIVAATPCHRAALAGYDEEGSRVRLRIRVREPEGTPACVQCIGTVPFELTARTRGAFETVVLDVGGRDPRTVQTTV